MKKVHTTSGMVILSIFIALFVTASVSFGLDYPHFEVNGIGCDSCHFVYGGQPDLLPPWTAHVPTDIDDTQSNTLCWSCHNDIEAPYVRTHSSLQTDNSYGDWTLECKNCHDPHYQKQADTYGAPSYLTSGISTGLTASTVTATGAGWTENEYQGLVVIPNILQKKYKYKILSNTSDTLTVAGPIDLTKAAAGNTYAVIYGKLVKSIIETPNSGSKAVRFFGNTGINSFADGDAAYDGVCEVCHTQTSYHRNNAAGNHFHNAGLDCATCHIHTDGFKGSGCTGCHGLPPVDAGTLASNNGVTGSATAGAHETHVLTKGIDCTSCHYDSVGSGATHDNSLTITLGFSLFGGTYQGGSYDGQLGVNYNTTTTSPATLVSANGNKTCSNIYCHSTGQSTADGDLATPEYAAPVWDDPSSAVCGTCHDVTELGGLTSGSHGAHLGTTGVNGCGDCHTDAADDASSYDSSNHVNASIDVANSYSAGGVPGNGYGTCSAASCHDDGTGNPAVTPQWGTDAANCTACHDEVPATGSHEKHITTTLYSKAECGDCHDSAVQGETPPEQHLDGNIDVYDSVSGDLGYPAHKTKGSGYTTCTTAYCHSSGQSVSDGNSSTPVYAAPSWGSPASAACGSCHKVEEAAGLTSGSHGEHLGSTGVNGCGDCHTGAADDASSYNSITHVDGFIDVDNTYSAEGAPGNGYGTCSTASCHDDGTGNMVATPAWGSGPAACTACHEAAPASGSHSIHLAAAGVACDDCHDAAVQGSTAPAQHLDGDIDVYDSAAGDLGYPQDKARGSAYTNCTTASCHDDGTGALVATPDWGTDAANCTVCHDAVPATGSHTNHLTTATGHGYKRPECGDCHDGAVESTTAPEQHIDGNIDVYDSVSGDLGYPEDKAKGSAYASCSTAYCHSSGQSYTDPNDATPSYTSPTWGNGEACGFCHKAETTHNFFAQTIDSASHTSHLAYGFKLGGSTSIKCTICHKWEASQPFGACNQCHGTAGANTYHADGAINVFLDTEFGPRTAYGDQTGVPGNGYYSCSNVYCHSTGQSTTDGNDSTPSYSTPTWGTAASGACGTCHAVTVGSLTSGSHDAHLNAAGVNGCGDCHTGAANDGSSYGDMVKHVNKSIDVANSYTAGGAPGNGYGSCTTSCHGSGSDQWGTDLSAYDTCTRCHGEKTASPTDAQKAPGGAGVDTNGDSAATDAQVGAHQAHMTLPSGYTSQLNSTGNCNECHIVPAATSDAGHVDTSLPAEVYPGGLNPEKADLNSVTPDYTTGTCTVYCHGADMPGGSNNGSDTAPEWNQTGYLSGIPADNNDGSGDCEKCHGSPPNIAPHTGTETLSDCDTCHLHFNDGGTLSNASLHIDGIVQATSDCDSCHGYPPAVGDGYAYRDTPVSEGKGAHATHVANIAAEKGVTLNAATDTFGAGAAGAVCGVCHTNNIANHMAGTRMINFGDGSTAYQFGPGAAVYNGTPGVSSATTPKTCSNISCHFAASPTWQDPATAGN